ncbi:MAG: hypothetical protein BWY82_02619 [Verrucomicrobia bacterium ADurb.Bin474]|nr:MAG: hypothetical protein BWY82_02619 [Verrucomicrobia bacterium ADurb.Bin474]
MVSLCREACSANTFTMELDLGSSFGFLVALIPVEASGPFWGIGSSRKSISIWPLESDSGLGFPSGEIVSSWI